MKAFNWSDMPLRIIYIKGNRFHLHRMHAVWLKKRKNRNLEGYILLQVSPVINHYPRNNPQMNGDVILLAVVHVNLWFLTKNRRQPLDEVRVRLEAFVFYRSENWWCMEVGINYWQSNSFRPQWEDLQAVTFFMALNMLPPDMQVDCWMKYNPTACLNDSTEATYFCPC